MLKVKVCGLSCEHNIAEIAALHPDYMGFVFYKNSPRYAGELHPDSVRQLPSSIRRVGVFVDAAIDEVVDTVQRFDIHSVQLHGSESPAYIAALRAYLRTHTMSKALRIGKHFPVELVQYYKRSVNAFVFDADGRYLGGNGVRFNWDTLARYDADIPYTLSGGIGESDVPALRALAHSAAGRQLYVVDINSQFEHSPGVKNVESVRNFLHAIRLLHAEVRV